MPASVVITEKKGGERQGLRSSSKPADPPAPEPSQPGCICGKKIAKKTKIKCSSCNRAFHADCVSLTGLQQSTLNILTGWQCPPCIMFKHGITISSLAPSLISELVQLVKAEVLNGAVSSFSPAAASSSIVHPPPSDQPLPGPSKGRPASHASETDPVPGPNLIQNSLAEPTDEDQGHPAGPATYADSVTAGEGWQTQTGRRQKKTHPLLPTPLSTSENSPAASVTPPKPPIHRMVVFAEDTDATLSAVRTTLQDIPVRAFKSEGKLTLLFDNEKYKADAAILLRSVLGESKVQAFSGVKVTVFNVPVPEDVEESQIVKYVTDGLMRKNPDTLKSADFKVVYTKRHVRKPELMNIRLRVSEELRDALLRTGRVNFDLTRCRVESFAYFKQCHHCQAPGHDHKSCPSKESPAVCMYCSKDHATESCTTKDHRETHVCSNCKATDHHAGYQGCPALQKHMMEISKNWVRPSGSRTSTVAR